MGEEGRDEWKVGGSRFPLLPFRVSFFRVLGLWSSYGGCYSGVKRMCSCVLFKGFIRIYVTCKMSACASRKEQQVARASLNF